MYIIAIGWIWVAFMMAITERSIVGGLMSFIFYGLLPCGLLLYLLGALARRRRQRQAEAEAELPPVPDTTPEAKPPGDPLPNGSQPSAS